jgi:hypothetical protein
MWTGGVAQVVESLQPEFKPQSYQKKQFSNLCGVGEENVYRMPVCGHKEFRKQVTAH